MKTFNEYQMEASKFMNGKLTLQEAANHSLYGLCSEVGELHGIYQKAYQGHRVDKEHVKKELGDILWFLAEFCTTNDIWLDEVAVLNIEKLSARYPNGFEVEKSIHRKEDDI